MIHKVLRRILKTFNFGKERPNFRTGNDGHFLYIKKRIEGVFDDLANNHGQYLTYRTMLTSQINDNQWIFAEDYSDVAIILQGPIPQKTNFLETVIRHYLNLYPNLVVIISSWQENNLSRFIETCAKLPAEQQGRLHFLQNEKPENPGIANVNLQIVSTFNALELASKLGKRFIIKSRVDQVLTNHLSISILREKFVHSMHEAPNLHKIVIGSRNTFLFRPYSFSDMLQFSDIETLISFWSVPLDDRTPQQLKVTTNSTPMAWSMQNLAEVYLVRNYLARVGYPPEFDFLSHLNALRQYFAVVDSESLGFYWNKYSHNQSSWARSDFPYPTYEISEHDYDHPEKFFKNSLAFSVYCHQPWG